ncbi:hypothetical protein [Rummeliibacillus pycnus]|uniref:hypothetical protein n=1 Tax=Rummeliibacillus pycnus TaxID=101070 RepID=UPI000C9B8DE7|nr:hypothetical protein [Rummeliibacillus pycnus]
MNIASLVSNRYTEIENRKRSLRQKTADDAYRKNAQYFKPKFNPALEELVELLTGKKEHEHQPEIQAAIHDLKESQETVTEDEVDPAIIDEQNGITKKNAASSIQQTIKTSQPNAYDLTIAIRENECYTTLASDNPSKQDDQVATLVTKNIHSIQGQSSQTSAASNVIPINEQEKAEIAKKRLFKKAVSRYSFHVQMAKQGFQFAQPTIYLAV